MGWITGTSPVVRHRRIRGASTGSTEPGGTPGQGGGGSVEGPGTAPGTGGGSGGGVVGGSSDYIKQGAYVDGLAADMVFFANNLTTALIGMFYTVGSTAGMAIDATVLSNWLSWLAADARRWLIISTGLLQDAQRGMFYDTSQDGSISSLWTTIAASGLANRIICRLGWEMNGWYDGAGPASATFPWGPTSQAGAYAHSTATGYKARYRHVHGLIRACSPHFRFNWCTNGWDDSVGVYYPGDDVVDYVGMDTYDFQQYFTTPDPVARWNNSTLPQLQGQNAWAVAHGKAATIDEWGVSTDNPYFITQTISYCVANRYAYLTYFDSSVGGVGTTLEANPNSLNAYVAATAGMTH